MKGLIGLQESEIHLDADDVVVNSVANSSLRRVTEPRCARKDISLQFEVGSEIIISSVHGIHLEAIEHFEPWILF